MSVAQLVADHRIVVCVGSGGVGKTTVAAALALGAARAGRRTMVLTIDPARRLADALGVGHLDNGGERVPAAVLAAAGLSGDAELVAGMLDQASAWDAFIARHAPSAEARDVILANPFYRNLSRTFAGSTEYMAIEELARIHDDGHFDLIVLDTPPSRHALDFLEAPRRLEEFFDRSLLSWLARPASAGWSAWKSASRSARFLFERIEDATGLQTLGEIGAFVTAIEGLVDGVAERGRKVRTLLAAPGTAFVLVTGPDEQVLEDAEGLVAAMRRLGVELRGVVMNRVQEAAAGDEDGDDGLASWVARPAEARSRVEGAARAAGAAPEAASWLGEVFVERIRQSFAQAVRREAFEAALPRGVVVGCVPERDRDVHDVAALAAIADDLSR